MIGILWFDQDPKTTLEQKINKALLHHTTRFGRKAEVVVVSIKDVDGVDLGQLSNVCKAIVKAARWVLPNCMIVGFEDQRLELA